MILAPKSRIFEAHLSYGLFWDAVSIFPTSDLTSSSCSLLYHINWHQWASLTKGYNWDLGLRFWTFILINRNSFEMSHSKSKSIFFLNIFRQEPGQAQCKSSKNVILLILENQCHPAVLGNSCFHWLGSGTSRVKTWQSNTKHVA